MLACSGRLARGVGQSVLRRHDPGSPRVEHCGGNYGGGFAGAPPIPTPRWVFVAYGGKSTVVTRGTNWTDVRDSRPKHQLESCAYDQGKALLNGYEVLWFKLSESASLPARKFDDDRSDHEILMSAIATITSDWAQATSIAASANGKVGGTLREAAGRPAAQTYEAMIHKLDDWGHGALLDSDDFRLWLAERSRAIENGGTKRKRGADR